MVRRHRRIHRRLHARLGVAISVPLLLLTVTGGMLLLKKHWHFVQPPEARGSGAAPEIGFDAILAAIRSVPGASGCSWAEVDRIDARPGKGLAKVRLDSGLEIQVDLGDGRVLQVAERRTDLIESLHDGSWFAGDWTRFGVMLPASALVCYLVASGLWMAWYPVLLRRRAARGIAARAATSGD